MSQDLDLKMFYDQNIEHKSTGKLERRPFLNNNTGILKGELSVVAADKICREAIKDWDDTGKLLISRGIMSDIIQYTINEATADLRAQLAERDAQLAAERAMADRLAAALDRQKDLYWNMSDALGGGLFGDEPTHLEVDAVYEAYQATRQLKQDKEGE